MERRNIAKLAAQVGGTKLPAHISIKGNVFSAVDDAGNRVHIGATLNCVIIDMNEKMSRLFWGVDAVYDEDNQTPPLCFSDNGIAPSTRSLQPQANSCAPDREGKTGCPWSVWGSGRSKKTGDPIPACQNGVKLALVLTKLKGKEWVPAIDKAPGAVFFFRVPPASLAAIASYGKTVAGMGKFDNPWTGEEMPYDTGYLITAVTFVSTGVVQFKAIGHITEQINGVIDEISQARVDAAIGRDDEPIAALPAPANGSHQGETVQPIKGGTVEPTALPQPKAPVASAPKKRGRPAKNGSPQAAISRPLKDELAGQAPAVRAFEPKPNDRFVTTQDVRDHAAQQQQEAKEAAQENPAFGMGEEQPDALDQFMNLDLK